MDMTQTVDDVCHLSPERSVVKTRRRQRVYDRITGVASVGTSPVPEASAKGKAASQRGMKARHWIVAES
jgi:hypothetical protein